MSNWFAYDWELRGAPARFQVDLAFAEPDSACRRYATLLYVSCDARRADAGSFSFWERRHLAPVLARCSTLLDGHGQHVGTIALPAHTRYYFYADDARLIVPIYEFCTDYAGLRLACAKADDPQQQTYFQLLYPDAAKRQSVANRSWIDARRTQGDDLQAPRRIDLTFSFPTAQARAAFSAEAASLGFTAGRVGFDEAQEAPYTQTLHASASLELRALTEWTTRGIAAAQPLGGTLCGLDAVFLSKKRPRS